MPSCLKRGMSSTRSTCACSMRQRGSRLARSAPACVRRSSPSSRARSALPLSPMAWKADLHALRHRRACSRASVSSSFARCRPDVSGRSRIGRLEQRAARAERAVHVELDRACDDQLALRLAECRASKSPASRIDGVVDAQRQLAGIRQRIDARQRGAPATDMLCMPVQPRLAYFAGALLVGVGRCRRASAAADSAGHRGHRVVDQHAGRQAVGADLDAAAVGLRLRACRRCRRPSARRCWRAARGRRRG